MRIRIFGKKDCAKCQTTKNKFNHFITKNNCTNKVSLEFHDMNTVDGMAEGAYHDVLKIPTTIIEANGGVSARWEGEVPKTEDFKPHFEEFAVKV